MKKKLSPQIKAQIMNRAMVHSKASRYECRDFRIMISPMRKNTLILRWTTINIENLEKPKQCFHYECFNEDGSSQNCSVNYTNQEEANQFFYSLTTLHQQNYCAAHQI